MIITNEIIESYYECKYKAYLKLQGHRGRKCDLEKLLIKQSRERFRQFCNKKLNRRLPKRSYFLTTTNSVINNDFLVNVEIQYKNFRLKCDVVKRVDAKSTKVKFNHVPILILRTEKVSKKNKIVVTAIAWVLNKILGLPVDHGITVLSRRFFPVENSHLRQLLSEGPVKRLFLTLSKTTFQHR